MSNPWDYPSFVIYDLEQDPEAVQPWGVEVSPIGPPCRTRTFIITYEKLMTRDGTGPIHTGWAAIVQAPDGNDWRSDFFDSRREAYEAAIQMIDARNAARTHAYR